MINGMKCNKSMSWILYLGQSNAGNKNKLGEQRLESSPAERGLGLLVGSRISVSQPCVLAARRANPILGCIKSSITSLLKEGIIPLYSALVWPHLESSVLCWAPQCQKYVEVLERIKRRATVLLKGLEVMSCEERLRTSGLSSLEKRRLRGHLLALYSFLGSGSGDGGPDLSSLGCDDRMCGNGQTLEQAS